VVEQRFPIEPGWPGRKRRAPRLRERSYLVHRQLAPALQSQIAAAMSASGGRLGTVLDVGCGAKPYLPWVRGRCERYVGIDASPVADVEAFTERLPVRDNCADLVLCTQVLEHVDDPAASISELGRVATPGGAVLASTHGVHPYHPTPQDYWRWTGAGLRKAFEDSARFSSIEVIPCGGTVGCLSYLLALYISLAGERLRKRNGIPGRLAAGSLEALVASVNAAGERLDSSLPAQRDPSKPNVLTANFLVAARA
jgi:SAM-dependent methyltransferase